MLIVCPNCAARYEVAEGVIGPSGKNVRCARCGTVWLARSAAVIAPETPVPWPEPPVRPRATDLGGPPPSPHSPRPDPGRAERPSAPPAEEARAAGADDRAPRPRSLAAAALIGWVATVVLLAVAGWGAYAYREAVIAAWPPSERLYLALGLRS